MLTTPSPSTEEDTRGALSGSMQKMKWRGTVELALAVFGFGLHDGMPVPCVSTHVTETSSSMGPWPIADPACRRPISEGSRCLLRERKFPREERQHLHLKIHRHLAVMIAFERFEAMRNAGIGKSSVHIAIGLKQAIL